MNKKRYIYIISCFMFIGIIGISIGFGTYSNNLSIGEVSANVRATVDIRVSDVVTKEMSSGVTVSNLEYNIHNLFGDVYLPNADSYAIFDVSILNVGNTVMGLRDISNLNPALKYEIVNNSYTSDGYKNYQLKGALCDNTNSNTCKSGSTTSVLVKISYADGGYNSGLTTYPLKLYFDFRQMFEVRAGGEFVKYIDGTLNKYVMSGESAIVKLKNVDASRFLHTMGGIILFMDSDYTYDNSILTIPNVSADVLLGESSIVSNNINLGSEWVDNYTVDITLNGTPSRALYMRIYKGDLFITNVDGSKLYVEYYALHPVLPAGANVYISFTPLSGTATLVSSFTVKLRDTEVQCNQIKTAELIAQTTGKTNFYINSSVRREGVLTTDASFISVYSAAGNTYDNFKFRISYGIV